MVADQRCSKCYGDFHPMHYRKHEDACLGPLTIEKRVTMIVTQLMEELFTYPYPKIEDKIHGIIMPHLQELSKNILMGLTPEGAALIQKVPDP